MDTRKVLHGGFLFGAVLDYSLIERMPVHCELLASLRGEDKNAVRYLHAAKWVDQAGSGVYDHEATKRLLDSWGLHEATRRHMYNLALKHKLIYEDALGRIRLVSWFSLYEKHHVLPSWRANYEDPSVLFRKGWQAHVMAGVYLLLDHRQEDLPRSRLFIGDRSGYSFSQQRRHHKRSTLVKPSRNTLVTNIPASHLAGIREHGGIPHAYTRYHNGRQVVAWQLPNSFRTGGVSLAPKGRTRKLRQEYRALYPSSSSTVGGKGLCPGKLYEMHPGKGRNKAPIVRIRDGVFTVRKYSSGEYTSPNPSRRLPSSPGASSPPSPPSLPCLPGALPCAWVLV